MKTFPKGVIAVHGYRKTFTKEEQIDIAIALEPVIKVMHEQLAKELANTVMVEVEHDEWVKMTNEDYEIYKLNKNENSLKTGS